MKIEILKMKVYTFFKKNIYTSMHYRMHVLLKKSYAGFKLRNKWLNIDDFRKDFQLSHLSASYIMH